MDSNAVLATIYWAIFIFRIKSLIRNRKKSLPRLIAITLFLWAFANTIKINVVANLIDSQLNKSGLAVFISDIAFMLMTFFLMKVLWYIQPPSFNMPRAQSWLGFRTGFVVATLSMIYFGNLADIKSYELLTTTDLQNPYALLYWTLYKLNFAYAHIWFAYHFFRIARSTNNYTTRIRFATGMIGGILAAGHFVIDFGAQVLGYLAIIDQSRWQSQIDYNLSYLSAIFYAVALIVPVNIFNKFVNFFLSLWGILLYVRLDLLFQEMEIITNYNASISGKRVYLWQHLTPFGQRYLSNRIAVISEGLRIVANYVVLQNSDTTRSEEVQYNTVEPAPQLIAEAIKHALVSAKESVYLNNLVDKHNYRFPHETIAFLGYLGRVENIRKKMRKLERHSTHIRGD